MALSVSVGHYLDNTFELKSNGNPHDRLEILHQSELQTQFFNFAERLENSLPMWDRQETKRTDQRILLQCKVSGAGETLGFPFNAGDAPSVEFLDVRGNQLFFPRHQLKIVEFVEIQFELPSAEHYSK